MGALAAALVLLASAATAGTAPRVAWRSTVQQGGHGGYQCYNAPSIVSHPTCAAEAGAAAAEPVLIAFLEARKQCHDHGVWMDLVSYRSLDGGRRWSPPRLVHGESDGVHNVTVGGPTAVVDRVTNRLVLLMIRNDPRRKSFDILLSGSSDCGKTFSPPRDISTQVKPRPGTPGAPWGFYATTFRAIQLASGRLLACCDHTINGQLDPYPISTGHSHVAYSDNHGEHWGLGGTVGLNSSDECSVAQLSSGTVVMNMRNYIDQKTKTIGGAGHIVRALADSSDMGATWGSVRFAASLPDPICFSDLLRVNASTHGMTAKASGDDLLLLSNPSSTVGRKNLSIHASLDGGHEWQPLVVVEDRGKRGSGYAHMVAMAPDPTDGVARVGVLYVENYHLAAQTNGPGFGNFDNHTFALVKFPRSNNVLKTDELPPAPSHLKHMTFYDYDAVDQVNISTFGWAGSLSPSGESAFTVCDRYFHSLGYKYMIDISDRCQEGWKVYGEPYCRSNTTRGLVSNWSAAVDRYVAEIKSRPQIVGVFLGDEPIIGGVPQREVCKLASYVKSALLAAGRGEVFVYFNDAPAPLLAMPHGLCDGLDYISADIYLPFDQVEQEAEAVKKVYDQVKQKLAPHQRLFVVPGLYWHANASLPPDMERRFARMLDAYYRYTISEPAIVGWNPWHYLARSEAAGGRGVKTMGPVVGAKVAEIGRRIARK